MNRQALIILGTLLLNPLWVTSLAAQELVDEAMRDFPAQTARLEYSSLAKLRALRNYDALRQRYLGARLQSLEKSLAKVGIEESFIDEVVLGWQTAAGVKSAGGWDLFGLVLGHFPADEIARRAAAQGVKPGLPGDVTAYCLPSDQDSICLALLDGAHGAFGSLKLLANVLAAREGLQPGLDSDSTFANLVEDTRFDAPIWGVAERPAIADWLRASVPGPGDAQLDWSQIVKGVDTMGYSVDVSDKVRVEIKLDCKSQADAANLRQALDGLRMLQRMLWQNKSPNLPNPFKDMELNSFGDKLELRLNTPLPTL